jgi:hypothetical protein
MQILGEGRRADAATEALIVDETALTVLDFLETVRAREARR